MGSLKLSSSYWRFLHSTIKTITVLARVNLVPIGTEESAGVEESLEEYLRVIYSYGAITTTTQVTTKREVKGTSTLNACVFLWFLRPIFTARKRILRRLCFYTCLSVILFGGGGGGIPACLAAGLWGGWGLYPQHALQVSRPTPKGKRGGSGKGGLQAHTQGGSWGVWPGGLQAHTLGGCL